jgi:hypothetical protein
LAHGLPVLIPANPLWAELVHKHGAGLEVNFERLSGPSVQELAKALAGQLFYQAGIPSEVFWASEGQKLTQMIDSIR